MSDLRRRAAPRKRARLRTLTGGFAATALVLALSSPAGAGPPNNQACLGEDFRMYAQGGSAWGDSVAGLASSPQGVGDEIQAHLAGNVPDDVIPNSCND